MSAGASAAVAGSVRRRDLFDHDARALAARLAKGPLLAPPLSLLLNLPSAPEAAR